MSTDEAETLRWREELYQSMDEDLGNWDVPWDHLIQPDERLVPDEWRLLREIIGRRSPELLQQLDIVGVRVQRPSEREPLIDILLDEFCEFGLAPVKSGSEWNQYGMLVDDLIGRLGRI